MFKFIKRSMLIVGLGIGLTFLAPRVEAQQVIVSIALTNNTTNILITNAAYISSMQYVSGTMGAPVTLTFYDSATTNIYTIITNAFYTRTTVLTNVTSVLTNGVGQVYTNVYPGQWTTIVTNAGETNLQPVIQYMAVAPSSVASRNTRITTVNGLNCVVPTAGTNITLTIAYSYPF